MPKEADLQVKVGMFVVAALACLIVFVFAISDFSIFKKGQDCRVVFSYADGLKKGAPVRVAGVDAGHVRAIRVVYDNTDRKTHVVAEAWMEAGHKVPADSTFMINQLGLLGEKYLEIIPGSSAALVMPGMTVRGEDPVPMETITKMVGSLGGEVTTTLNNINNGILTEGNKTALAATLAHLAGLTESLNKGLLTETNTRAFSAILANTADLTGMMKSGDGTVGKFLTDPDVFTNLEELSADLKANPWKLFYRPKGK